MACGMKAARALLKMDQRPKKKRRFRLWFILGFAACCELLYVVVVNAFLSFGGLQLLFRSTNTVNATYERAFSVWPGVAYVKNLRIIFQDHNLQWSLDIENIKAHIALHELVRRRFHVTRLEGSGAAFRMRHRILPQSADKPWVSALPPIPEYRAPAVFEPTVPEPPIPDSQYNLWTVHLERVDVGVKEVWVQFVKYAGAGRVRGAFQLVPARNLWVGPAFLDLTRGRLAFGEESIASRLVGAISCKVDFFDVRVPQGKQVFRYINSNIELAAQGFRFEPFAQFFDPGLAIDAKPGILRVDLHVRRGRVLAGSGLDYESDFASFAKDSLRAAGHTVHLASRMDSASSTETTLQVDRAEMGPKGEMQLRAVRGRLVTKGNDLAGDFALESKQVEVGSFRLPRAKDIHVILARRLPFSVTAGSLGGSFGASDTRGELSSHIDIGLAGVQVEMQNVGAKFDGQLQLVLSKDFSDSLRIGMTSKLHRLALLLEHGRVGGVLHLVNASSSFDTYRQRVSGQFELDARSAESQKLDSQPSSRVTGKQLFAKGTIRGTYRSLQAQLALTFRSLEMHSASVVLRVQPVLRVFTEKFDAEQMIGALGASLHFAGWNATYGDDGGQCSSLDLPLADFLVSGRFDRRRIRAHVTGNLLHQTLAWGSDFKARADLHFLATAVVARKGRGPTPIHLTALVSNLRMRSGKGLTQGWEIDTPQLRLDGNIATGERSTGALELHLAKARGRIGTAVLATDLSAEIPHLDFDSINNELQFTGRVRLDKTEVDVGTRKVQAWWSEIDVPAARLVVRRNLDVSATFHAAMRDATPGLAVLQNEGEIPSWLANIVPLRRLSTDGVVERHCRLTDIKFDRAVGGPLTARGRLLSTSDHVRGSFLVRLAGVEALSAGVEVGPPDSGLSLLAGDGWLREHTQRLDYNARQVLTEPCSVEPQNCSNSESQAKK